MQQLLAQGLSSGANKRMINIRKASSDDTPQLEKLFLEVRQNTFTWKNPNGFKIEDYQNSIKGETVFVAEDDEQILGFISVCEYESPAFIHHLFVAKSHQRQGIGRLLILGIFPLIPLPYQLKCFLKNENAISFYLKHGWSILDTGVSKEGDYVLLELIDSDTL